MNLLLMYKLGVDISEAQMKRLHKGHKVRVKKGKGICLIVNPNTYNLASRAFAKKKGSEIQLTPEEIEMNRNPHPYESEEEEEMEGSGFLEDFGRPAKNLVGSGFWDDLGNKVATNLGRLADKGTTKLENMIGEGSRRRRGSGFWDDLGNKVATNLGRLADKGTTKLENMIGEGSRRRRGRPKKGRGMWDDLGNKVATNLGRLADKGTTKLENMIDEDRGHRNIKQSVAQAQLANNLNEHLGTNYGYLNRAGLDNAINNAKSAAMAKLGIDARFANAPRQGIHAFAMQGKGMPPPSRMVGGQLERGSIGRGGGMLSSYTPPALVSQPFSANFQFQHFLPPQYQHFNAGGEFDGSGFH